MDRTQEILGKIMAAAMLAGVLLGLFTVIAVPFEMFRMAEAEHWPSRKGVVTLSYATQKSGAGRAPWWRADICGTYRDNGERFCIKRVRYGSFRYGGGKAISQAEVAKYPVGREVDVFYSPDDPNETILESKGAWSEMTTLLALGSGFLLLPLVLWFLRRQIEPRPPRRP